MKRIKASENIELFRQVMSEICNESDPLELNGREYSRDEAEANGFFLIEKEEEEWINDTNESFDCSDGSKLEPGKSIILTCETNGGIRKLTPTECFRLMGVDDEDSEKILKVVSKTNAYKLAGNSIVVDNLFHLFRKMFVEQESEEAQLSLF